MLQSKTKIKKQIINIYDLLQLVESEVSNAKIKQIQQRNLFKESVNIIFAVLANFTTPINKKLNALKFLKKLFQTAHPQIISEAEKIIPVLVEIVMSPEILAQSEQKSGLYFVLKELRPVDEVEKSRRYVRFAMEIIKQWAQYMIDLGQTNTVYTSQFKFCQDNVSFYPYFLYFTMKDYVQFMTNWLKRKKSKGTLEDKIKIYQFLTNPNVYNRNLQFYRNNLSQNADVLVFQTYSLLINHSIPVEAKLQVLSSMKDLYQEGNFIYSEKIQQLISPYFFYVVNILQKGLVIQRYFEMVQRRLGVDYNHSKQYIFTLLQLALQWDKYNAEKANNPYAETARKIKNKGFLNGITTPIFQGNDIIKYNQNMNIARHRQHQYIIPEHNKQFSNAEMRQKLKQYQRKLNDFNKRQRQYQQKIEYLIKSSPIKQLNHGDDSAIINRIISNKFPLPSQQPSIMKHIISNDFPLPQQKPPFIKQIISNNFQLLPKPNQDKQFEVVINQSRRKIRQDQLFSKQKQLMQKMQRNKSMTTRSHLINERTSDNFEDVFKIKTGPRRLSEAKPNTNQYDLFELPIGSIHKYSDAVKYKQMQLSTSRKKNVRY